MCRGMNLVVRDESEDERAKGQANQEEQEEEEVLNLGEEKLFKALTKIGKRPKFKVPTFSGKLNPEELIDWINELEEYFEYEEIEDPDRVKFAKAKLKGHAKVWWQEVQLDRNNRGKDKITKWERMVAKLKQNSFILIMSWIC